VVYLVKDCQPVFFAAVIRILARREICRLTGWSRIPTDASVQAAVIKTRRVISIATFQTENFLQRHFWDQDVDSRRLEDFVDASLMQMELYGAPKVGDLWPR
jgi:hypothetical protein